MCDKTGVFFIFLPENTHNGASQKKYVTEWRTCSLLFWTSLNFPDKLLDR